jgi:hypothetical protein
LNFPKLLVPHGDKLCFIEFVRGPKKPGYQVTRLPGYQVTKETSHQVKGNKKIREGKEKT